MKIAIMQPYFLPYVGYFQLIGAVDQFIIYDNIEYTKKGWINRNRMLRNGIDAVFSLPLEKGSDYLDIRDRRLAANFNPTKLQAQIEGAYRKAPRFKQVMPLIADILFHPNRNLFHFVKHSLVATCAYLGLNVPIMTSSEIEGGSTGLKSQDRVLDICKRTGATTYINSIGGRELYQNAAFAAGGIELFFLQARPFEYEQFGRPFVPWLSILDVMMFNAPHELDAVLNTGYDLVRNQ